MTSRVISYVLIVVAACMVGCDNAPDRISTSDSNQSTQQHSVEVFSDSFVNVGDYSYFLSSAAPNVKRSPILLFFDPQGNGSAPLEKYRSLADDLGIVLVGSNVAKNGVAMDEISNHYSQLTNQLRKSFPDNAGSLVLAGFSGGAKVALQVGMSDPSVVGIIANGAMMETKGQRPDMPLALVAGKGDLNHGTMLMSSLQMIRSRPQTVFMQFDGGHEWADKNYLKHLIAWILSRSGFANSADRARMAEELFSSFQGESGIDEFINLRAISTIYGDQPSVQFAKARLKDLAAGGELSKSLDAYYKISDREEAMKQDYVARLQNIDLNWWKAEISRLRNQSEGASDEAYQAQRLLGFIGLFCYMAAEQMLQQPGSDPSGIVDVYLLAEPDNPEALRMKRLITK